MEQMEKQLQQLEQIKRVSPNADLFSKIENRIERKQKSIIPLFWARAAAAALICLMVTEIYVVVENQQVRASDISEVLPESNNTLYYEYK
jgi:hypothetical protein